MRLPGTWPPAPTGPYELHRRLPGYEVTPLRELDADDAADGVRVFVKDESCRFGLPAFKVLGAWWAITRALGERLRDIGRDDLRERVDGLRWDDVSQLAELFAPLRPLTLAAATDGNHGRGVAHVARRLGMAARIWVPAGTAAARIEAIRSEGAEVVVSDGSYDQAVHEAAAAAGPTTVVIADTADGGSDPRVPEWVVEGYSTIFREVDDQLAAAGVAAVDVVVVPVGVGALAAAAATHYRAAADGPALVGVEPTDAACVTASVNAGHIVSLEGVQRSVMAGLNCGTPSAVAWPRVSQGFDWFITVDDAEAEDAVRSLAARGIVSGESGAASLAGWRQLAAVLPADPSASWPSAVLLISTEGATDPESFRRVTGREPASVQPQAG